MGSEPWGRMVTVVDSLDKEFQYDEKTEGESTTASEERWAMRATEVMDDVSGIITTLRTRNWWEMSDTVRRS